MTYEANDAATSGHIGTAGSIVGEGTKNPEITPKVSFYGDFLVKCFLASHRLLLSG
ncbi:hypothetical protein QTH97_36775 [Variovorax sp. J22R24]|uniref:hypothetical protein n=1 Tax=Variovorax gracilis TaxID=3053502 RepID=UPI002574A74B|nr:hypothetical protein [Variovorax sp. J22R24]MDM0110480.1 hypothetical protein [Variovorax sp. J22R24]